MVDIPAISTGLKLGQDGIWYGSEQHPIAYPDDGNQSCFTIEDRSFWFIHRNRCITTVVSHYPPADRGAIFDIGGGNGFVSLGLAQAGFEVVVVEPGQAGALNARRRGLPQVVCATTQTANFQPGSLPAVGLFDVIEHIQDDRLFLQSIRALIQPGGRLYVTVPAYSFLWSGEDVFAGHYRRYSLRQICQVLRSAGFKVEFSSYIFQFLWLPILLLRVLPYKLGISKTQQDMQAVSRDHAAGRGGISRLLNWILQPELATLRHQHSMRFGGSCLVVAQNPYP